MVTICRWKLALLWALSLVVATALTAAAQARRGQPSGNDAFTLESPTPRMAELMPESLLVNY